MGDLVGVLRQGRVVVFARGVGVQPKVELVLPAEVEARAAQRVVAQLRGRVTLGEIGRRGRRCGR